MRPMAAVLVTITGLAVQAWAQEPPLVAGRDVVVPRKVHAPAPPYPTLGRQARVGAFVFLEVALSAEGRPTDIKVLRGHPIFDEDAVAAVEGWRYEPTVIDGVPRSVKLAEVIAFFLNEEMRVDACAWMAADRSLQPGVRVFAVSQLVQLPPKKRDLVEKILQPLVKDQDQAVAAAAQSGLTKLKSEVK